MTNPQPQTPNTYKVLFVCTGNLCRSPMAAAMFNAHHKPPTPNAQPPSTSAGTSGVDCQPAHPLAVELMAKRGIDLSTHRAQTVTPGLLTASSLILTMETTHQEWILNRMPTLQGRVQRLGRWRELEILDPLAGGLPEFQRAAEEIDQCITDWLPHLKSGTTTESNVQAQTKKSKHSAPDRHEPKSRPSSR